MQKATGKGHTSPGETFAEKKEVSHSSTTFTCRVSVATIDKKKFILPVITQWIP